MSQANAQLKERVRQFWQEHPCGTKFADAPPGSRRFYELVEEHRYSKEWHIPGAAGFSETKNLRVLEIGCGLGTDGAQFAKAGADYTGVDLTDAAVELAQKRFELFGLPGTFRTADAERLDFPDDSFDIVYSHGVLHHTPDTAGAVKEVHRVLKPGGRAVVMLYHRDSYNYRVNISVLRRGGVHMLRWNSGIKLVRLLTGESEEALREHARRLKKEREYLKSREHRELEIRRWSREIGDEKERVVGKKIRRRRQIPVLDSASISEQIAHERGQIESVGIKQVLGKRVTREIDDDRACYPGADKKAADYVGCDFH